MIHRWWCPAPGCCLSVLGERRFEAGSAGSYRTSLVDEMSIAGWSNMHPNIPSVLRTR
jgi:hypothetical protein